MPLDLRSCATIAEAANALRADRNAILCNGGTLVMRDVNEGRITDGVLIRVTDPAFRAIRVTGTRAEIGAGATMAMLLATRELACVHAAARGVGGPAIRTMATVGGNLFAPTPYGDLTTALLALDAVVTLHAGGERQMPLDALLRERERAPGLVTRVTFALPAQPDAFRFVKVARVRPKGISILSIAAHLPGGSRMTGVRIAYGALAPTPIRARGVERALEGRSLDAAAIDAAAARAVEDIAPQDDAIASAWYRREVLPVHLSRLLHGPA